jgi:steroid 5-alpha reductase family enzyme
MVVWRYTMILLDTFLFATLVIFCYMTSIFILALVLKDNSIADIAWGPGFIIAAIAAIWYNRSFDLLQMIVLIMVSAWGLRLATRIFLRNRGRGEDPRYKKWRESWGKFFILRSYLQVFLLQGLILLVNVSPVLVIAASERSVPAWSDYIGIALWICGFLFETIGDYQLDAFMRDPASRGKIIDRGLWRYSRHPNYFGEVTMWWGIFIIALPGEMGWISVAGPAVITAMILFVSGIPMTERMMARHPGFEEYKKRTSVFIPWFPKKA